MDLVVWAVHEPYTKVFVLLEEVVVVGFVVLLVLNGCEQVLCDYRVFGDDITCNGVEVFHL